MPETIHDLTSQLIVDSKGSADVAFCTLDSSLWAFMPELVICATIVLMLLIRVFRFGQRFDMFYLALAGAIISFTLAAPWTHLVSDTGAIDYQDPGTVTRMEIFTGMLVYDTFGVFIRSLLFGFLILFVLFTKLSGLPDRDDGPDVYTLVFGATLGMCLMATSNHLLMIFLSVEMASVPSYALAGMLKGRRLSSEAALKYSVYGAGAAGVMLYGISLIAGLLNSAHLPTMAVQLAEKLPDMPAEQLMVLSLGALMIMVGLAFKLSAVPFHFWCPDVFEGATAEVNAFLSVASKAAALALLIRVAVGFGALPPESVSYDDVVMRNGSIVQPPADAKYFDPGVRTALRSEGAAIAFKQEHTSVLMVVADEEAGKANRTMEPAIAPVNDRATLMANLERSRDFIGKFIAVLAIITCTFGNLAAYGQTNFKRLMAYSTIAHAGYMMMAVPVIVAAAGHDPQVAHQAVSGLCIYMFVYLFMNLGVFAVIAFLRNAMHSEEIADYAGLIKRCPGTVVALAAILFSLVGMPPLAGFIGKFAIFASLADGYSVTGQSYLIVLLVAGAINTAISLFYYLRVVKVMTIDPEPEDRPPFEFSDVSGAGAYIWLITLPTIGLIINWDGVSNWALAAARHLF